MALESLKRLAKLRVQRITKTNHFAWERSRAKTEGNGAVQQRKINNDEVTGALEPTTGDNFLPNLQQLLSLIELKPGSAEPFLD